MANEYGLFWNSNNGDRVYDADDFAEWLRKFFTSGVFEGECQVTAAGGMNVSVAKGYVNIEGKVKFFDTPTTLTLANAGSSYSRIDTIVAECNYTDRKISLKAVTGSYSTSPEAQNPVRDNAAYQIVLAKVAVNAGASEIVQENITDTRTDPDICGYVAATVEKIDFSQFSAQFDDFLQRFKDIKMSDFSGWQDGEKEKFDEWFENIKSQLSEDAAGNLQNQVDELDKKVSILNGSYAEEAWAGNCFCGYAALIPD